MKPIERGEVLGLAEYEAIRDRFRARVIEEKKARRTTLGDRASCLFENRDTVLMQIQEMLRTERISREAAIQHEIDTYNELVPKDHELSATILIEIDDKEAREKFLTEARGLEDSFALVIAGERCPGHPDASREGADRTTAVHYVKFALTPAAEAALRSVLEKRADVPVALASSHPRYEVTTPLPAHVVASIAEDLT
jgi:hypothetical protein